MLGLVNQKFDICCRETAILGQCTHTHTMQHVLQVLLLYTSDKLLFFILAPITLWSARDILFHIHKTSLFQHALEFR